MRQYRHEFSSFKDGRATDFAYYNGETNGSSDTKLSKDDEKKQHTSLSIRSAIALALQSPDAERDSGDDGKVEAIDASAASEPTLDENRENHDERQEQTKESKAVESTELHDLGVEAVDHHLLKLSAAAVDTGGAMTNVHRYDKEKERMMSLAESLALVVSRCILPHASRMTCDGYGKKEALQALKVLSNPSVIQVLQEEATFMETMFLYYAEVRDGKLLGPEYNKHKGSAVSFAEIMEFGKDFALLPSLATQTELFMCFRSSM